MKIVAFIDSLGFRNKILKLSHEEAKEIINLFNETIFNLWEEFGFENDPSIFGRTFSDSFILYTVKDDLQSLDKVLVFLQRLYKDSIVKCDLPLRGGISVGEYSDIEAEGFSNLQKGQIIGNGFIDAYALESMHNIKGSKIIFRHDINLTIKKKLPHYKTQSVRKLDGGEVLYELKWGDIEYLTQSNYLALNKFVDQATKSQWLDHYYNTLQTFLVNEDPQDKKQIFIRIIRRLKSNFKYYDLDNFLENFMTAKGITPLRKAFLSFLRERL